MSPEEKILLRELADAHDQGGFAMACDGKDRALAHGLEKAGFAKWKGTNWGSSFWAITDAGIDRAIFITKGELSNDE